MHYRHVIKSGPLVLLSIVFLTYGTKAAAAKTLPCNNCPKIMIEAYGSSLAKVTPDHLLVTSDAKITWSSADGDWEVEWKDNNPCNDIDASGKKKKWKGKKNQSDSCHISAPCDKATYPNGCPYTYKIRVTTEDPKPHTADPDIIVDAGGGGPDTRKKSASPDRKK